MVIETNRLVNRDVGTAIGAATNNIGLWMPVELCLGLALGYSSEDDNDDTDDKQ